MSKIFAFLLIAFSLAGWEGCSTSHKSLIISLDEIGKLDLDDILKELPPKAKSVLLAKPYVVKDEFEEFKGDSSLVFQARATLIFFYLDPSLDLCQVRKYRYRTTARIWDRYDVKLMHIPKKYTGSKAH